MQTVSSQLARYISKVASHRTDGDLLAGFLNGNAEIDFAELVRRHGPMVWGICRRSLPDYADAEDAFQTVFLVLVQRGRRVVEFSCLGPWLHRVAVWTTRNVRRRNARRLARQSSLPEQLPISTANADLALDLDAALMALPEKFRSSIVLCHLLGCSRADAAAQLGCAERTLSSWLSRGLEQLRTKLSGFDPVKALAIGAVAIPIGLSDSVVRAAVSLQSAAIASSVLSPTISQLVEGVIRMFWVKKATAASIALFTVFAFGVGIGVSTRQLSTAAGGEEKIGVAQAPVIVDQQADQDDITIAKLEKLIEVHRLTLDAKKEEVKILAKTVAKLMDLGLNSEEVQKQRDLLKRSEEEAENIAAQLEKLQAKLKKLQEFKALNALDKIKSQT